MALARERREGKEGEEEGEPAAGLLSGLRRDLASTCIKYGRCHSLALF